MNIFLTDHKCGSNLISRIVDYINETTCPKKNNEINFNQPVYTSAQKENFYNGNVNVNEWLGQSMTMYDHKINKIPYNRYT